MAKSVVGSVLPLVITFALIAVIAAIVFVAYSIAMDVADKTNKKMEKKNLAFSKGGMKVGVRERTAEEVGDSTQRYLHAQ